MGAKHLALIVGLALVASAGIAAATFQGMSIWGGNNPGQGGLHAAMPDAAAAHNRAGENHPPSGGDGGDEPAAQDNGNGTSEGGSCRPADVPPAHAKDGEPEDGKPSDVPPAHAKDGVPSGCHPEESDEGSPA
jgi:hypothetical protein